MQNNLFNNKIKFLKISNHISTLILFQLKNIIKLLSGSLSESGGGKLSTLPINIKELCALIAICLLVEKKCNRLKCDSFTYQQQR